MAQGRGPGNRKRLLAQQRDVMAPVLDHLALLVAAGMISHQLRIVKKAHAERVGLERQALVGILDGHGVVVGLKAHPPRRMDQDFHHRTHLRRMGWQRSQIGALNLQARGDRISPPGHDALLIRETIGVQVRVDSFQVTALGKRHEIVSTRIAYQIFDTTFLPTSMDIGKERLEAIDTVEMQKHLVLTPAMSLQDLEHSRFEVIVDRHAWHASPELKGMALTEQKGFLPLRGETFDKHRS